MSDLISSVILSLVFFSLLLLCRELWCWYLKINIRLEVQEQTLEELKKIRKHLDVRRAEHDLDNMES